MNISITPKILNKLNYSFSTFVYIGYAVFVIQLLFLSISFLHSLFYIDYTLVVHNALYRTIGLIVPIFLWMFSTNVTFFNYHRTKTITYVATIYNETLILTTLIFQILSRLFLPFIMSIRTDHIFTKNMVIFLARLLVEVPTLLCFFLLLKGLLHPIQDPKTRNIILNFKLAHYIRLQKKRKTIQYPLTIAKDVKTGKNIVVSENDRFLHALVDGTSGTGKTSSTILPAIHNDLKTRGLAEQKQMSLLWSLLKKGLVTYNGESSFFSINNFTYLNSSSTSDNNTSFESLEDIRSEYPVCGITVLAPEDSLTNNVCQLCDAKHIPYNRIDATPDINGKPKTNWIGMNPFYISPSLSGDKLHQSIVKKAVIFSDVMQVITDLKGKADSYFTGLNRQMLANLAILIMNTIPVLQQRHATPEDLQLLINNFDLLHTHVSKLAKLDKQHPRYTFILQYIRDDLLGKGRTKMEDQSRGTRNIINEFLLMPESKKIYCSQNSIDFDRILENGEITVCNYDLASGDSNAVAFGLFFLLSFNNAVLSRPGSENTRSPHFFYIDELPVLIHSSLEKNFALFRKFKVAMFCAIQTLDQFQKNEITKYLKGVILGCAHLLVFGRSSLSDMETFSALAGMKEETISQDTVSETALSSETPTLSYSSRETPTPQNVVEEIDIRMRDFQEITFFTTQDGRPLPPMHAKVDFLKDTDWLPEELPPLTIAHFQAHTQQNTTPTAMDKRICSIDEHTIKSIYQYSENVSENQCKVADIHTTNKATDLPHKDKPPSSIPDGSETLNGLF